MRTADELIQKYKSRNLMEELSWAANYTRKGYMSAEYEDYYSWLAIAAYRRIKELEQENSTLKSKVRKKKSEGLARCNTGESGVRYRNRNDFCSRGKREEG